jgi:phospho-N-acetylmuramoyl-pentapeptide-transferase
MNASLTDMIRILVPATAAFSIGILCTPILTHYLYTYRAWKKKPGKLSLDGTKAEEFNRLHEKHEVRAPRMGGIVIWGSVLLTALVIYMIAHVIPGADVLRLDFLSRSQTWIPLAVLLIGSLVGLVDDLLIIQPDGQGLPLRARLIVVVLLSTFIGWWFWDKLDITAINIPFSEPLTIGAFIVPFFVLMSLGLYASGVIDGIDGLSGGVFASVFASYTIIAFAQNQINLAAFSAAIMGGILAFLWYNIPPARFYMSDTGTMGLTLTIGTLAFMTDNLGGGVGISVLPIIGMLLVLTVMSDILQVLSKRIFGRKLFRVAPLHHHFEAIGWPGYKVVMRYWVLSVVFAVAGVIIALASISVG